MFTEEFETEAQDPQKDMKIKLLDDLIEKIMSMDDGAEEKAELPIEENAEGAMGEDQEDKDKLAQLKGI